MYPCYWTTSNDFGAEHTITNGGYYEAIENGSPQPIYAGNEYIGFKQSSTPEVCMSTSPEGSLFAVAHNAEPGEKHIYKYTGRMPDVDLTTNGFDFALIEEVRFRDVSEDAPLDVSKLCSVGLTQTIIDHVDKTYSPYSTEICTRWGRQVKSSLVSLIEAGQRIENLEYEDPYSEYDEYRPQTQ